MKYKEYLNSEEWKVLRNLVLRQADNRCEFCGIKAYAVHHVTYPKNFEDDDTNNLIAVCQRCHNLLHGIKEKKLIIQCKHDFRKEKENPAVNFLKIAIMNGFLLDKECMDILPVWIDENGFKNKMKEIISMNSHKKLLTINDFDIFEGLID